MTKIRSAGAPAFTQWRDELPGKPKPPINWWLDKTMLEAHVAAAAADSTDPWIGLQWGYTFETISGPGANPIAMQHSANAFDVEAWRAQVTPDRPVASPVMNRARDYIAFRKIVERITGRHVPVGFDHKRLEGWNTQGKATNRVLDRPAPVNPKMHPEGYLFVEADIAVMVLSVTSKTDGPRWCVCLMQRKALNVATAADRAMVERCYGRQVFRAGPIQVWEMTERLAVTWHDDEADLAVEAGRKWVTEMRASLDIPTYTNEVPMDPEDLYHAQVVSEETGLSEARVVVMVTD